MAASGRQSGHIRYQDTWETRREGLIGFVKMHVSPAKKKKKKVLLLVCLADPWATSKRRKSGENSAKSLTARRAQNRGASCPTEQARATQIGPLGE